MKNRKQNKLKKNHKRLWKHRAVDRDTVVNGAPYDPNYMTFWKRQNYGDRKDLGTRD